MTDVWTFVRRNLAMGQDVVLLVVTAEEGSTPGKPGFKMAIAADGSSIGTVGGGIMEMNLIRRAAALSSKDGPVLWEQVHRANAPEAVQSGMICAGRQWVVAVPLGAGHAETVDRICYAVEKREMGLLQLERRGMVFTPQTADIGEPEFRRESEDKWLYRESLGFPDTVYVVGSGHVGLAVCAALAQLDMRVVVFDHRAEVNTFRENRFAHEKIHCACEDVGAYISEGSRSFVVIVTTAFKTDAAALQAVLGKSLRYIGLMGSAAKIRRIFRTVGEMGADPAALARVKAPIGVSIHAQTPAEIAVSICAEIIKVRREPKPAP